VVDSTLGGASRDLAEFTRLGSRAICGACPRPTCTGTAPGRRAARGDPYPGRPPRPATRLAVRLVSGPSSAVTAYRPIEFHSG